jgi:hypothetical protein
LITDQVDPNQADCKADYSDYNEQLEIQKIRLPNEADFLFAYAAVPGSIFNLCLYMCTKQADQKLYTQNKTMLPIVSFITMH